jgi:hypothetical protein
MTELTNSTVGVDPVTHRTRQASYSLRGNREEAEAWIEADHPWKPSTLVGYRSVARFLTADPIARCRAQQLMPTDVRTAMLRWRQMGASDAMVAGRFRTLRAALGWAYAERVIDQLLVLT